ncbi:hypothetical protein Ae201684P_018196 [Aphanomyces euteiches]|uniref:Uncharacterized protein n=1 Tax=Aphanomyces euteiches TaxID=100861 RepID=A0A6G0X3P0_9STRA|nr:hypothetical protein Ae201684_008892 [Aphanomyces euteiches]KAH9054479.1 hypothetical protein Ae201684P_018196 [Aphanomyces euteiches]
MMKRALYRLPMHEANAPTLRWSMTVVSSAWRFSPAANTKSSSIRLIEKQCIGGGGDDKRIDPFEGSRHSNGHLSSTTTVGMKVDSKSPNSSASCLRAARASLHGRNDQPLDVFIMAEATITKSR